MTQRELKERLRTALRDVDIPVRQEHIALTRQLARQAPRRFIGRDRIGFSRFVCLQIRFIGWKIWVLQGVMLAAIRLFLMGSIGKDFLNNPPFTALLLCCLSVLILMTALPFVHRSIQYKMHETEAATRFSSAKLLIAKLLIVGFGDVCMLGCMLCFAVLKTPLSADSAMLYLLFPFLLACSGLLFLLSHISAARFVVGGVGLCVLLFTVFSLLAGVCPAFYQQTFSLSWAVVCLLLAALCLTQFRRILQRCPYADMQAA